MAAVSAIEGPLILAPVVSVAPGSQPRQQIFVKQPLDGASTADIGLMNKTTKVVAYKLKARPHNVFHVRFRVSPQPRMMYNSCMMKIPEKSDSLITKG